MIRKFFPLDKNYVLEQAQLSLQPALLGYLVDFVKVQYMLQYNPLGIVDETVQRIASHTSDDHTKLDDLYLNLMGIFRFRNYHNNQLEFGFDGREPFKQYSEEWELEFKNWARELCQHKNFIWGLPYSTHRTMKRSLSAIVSIHLLPNFLNLKSILKKAFLKRI